MDTGTKQHLLLPLIRGLAPPKCFRSSGTFYELYHLDHIHTLFLLTPRIEAPTMSLALSPPSHVGCTSPAWSPANEYQIKQDLCRLRVFSKPGLTPRKRLRNSYREYRGPHPSRESESPPGKIRVYRRPGSRRSGPICEAQRRLQQTECLDDEATVKLVKDASGLDKESLSSPPNADPDLEKYGPIDEDGKGTML